MGRACLTRLEARMASVRYIVRDVDAALRFYAGIMGFKLVQQFGPAMAIVAQGDLSLWLAGPSSAAAKPLADGAQPQPGCAATWWRGHAGGRR